MLRGEPPAPGDDGPDRAGRDHARARPAARPSAREPRAPGAPNDPVRVPRPWLRRSRRGRGAGPGPRRAGGRTTAGRGGGPGGGRGGRDGHPLPAAAHGAGAGAQRRGPPGSPTRSPRSAAYLVPALVGSLDDDRVAALLALPPTGRPDDRPWRARESATAAAAGDGRDRRRARLSIRWAGVQRSLLEADHVAAAAQRRPAPGLLPAA